MRRLSFHASPSPPSLPPPLTSTKCSRLRSCAEGGGALARFRRPIFNMYRGRLRACAGGGVLVKKINKKTRLPILLPNSPSPFTWNASLPPSCYILQMQRGGRDLLRGRKVFLFIYLFISYGKKKKSREASAAGARASLNFKMRRQYLLIIYY